MIMFKFESNNQNIFSKQEKLEKTLCIFFAFIISKTICYGRFPIHSIPINIHFQNLVLYVSYETNKVALVNKSFISNEPY